MRLIKIAAAAVLFTLVLTSFSFAEKKKTLDETLKPMATFVELGSVNCMPCKMMQPVMEDIEKEYAGQVKVVFHDVWTDEGAPYGKQYKIRAIPTQVFLDKDGKEFFRHLGFFPKEEIAKVLEEQGITRPNTSVKTSDKTSKTAPKLQPGEMCK